MRIHWRHIMQNRSAPFEITACINGRGTDPKERHIPIQTSQMQIRQGYGKAKTSSWRVVSVESVWSGT
jgi:hypothetical protein